MISISCFPGSIVYYPLNFLFVNNHWIKIFSLYMYMPSKILAKKNPKVYPKLAVCYLSIELKKICRARPPLLNPCGHAVIIFILQKGTRRWGEEWSGKGEVELKKFQIQAEGNQIRQLRGNIREKTVENPGALALGLGLLCKIWKCGVPIVA